MRNSKKQGRKILRRDLLGKDVEVLVLYQMLPTFGRINVTIEEYGQQQDSDSKEKFDAGYYGVDENGKRRLQIPERGLRSLGDGKFDCYIIPLDGVPAFGRRHKLVHRRHAQLTLLLDEEEPEEVVEAR